MTTINPPTSNASSLWGTKYGVLTPATNLTVEDELWSMRVPGATIATARIVIDQVQWREPQDLEKFVQGVQQRIPDAITHVMQAQPDALVLGISISVLWGGLQGNDALKAKVKADTGLALFTPVDAIAAALKAIGVQRVGVVTPYPQLADAPVRAFFEEIGIAVLSQRSLRAGSATAIGEIPPAEVRQALRDAAVPGAQALVTLGTDLKISRIAAQAEDWLGLPTVAVNAATWWFALRGMGLKAQLDGWGSLLRDH
jgi:maleate isomerase